MSAKATLYKASIDREIRPPEIESLVAANGGLIYRVDQGQGTTVVFFSSGKQSAEEFRKALSRRGKVRISTTTQQELLKLP
jgi:hypothetical protein